MFLLTACSKSDFLAEKPNTDIIQPKTIDDLFMLMDNTTVLSFNGGLGHLASDDYEVSYEDWQAASATERNSYIWAEDLFGGDTEIKDWNNLYNQVFYANNVLERLAEIKEADKEKKGYIKGWALFARSYANYDLIRNFCVVYEESSAGSDLGIPIRLSAGIDTYEERSTLQESFDQVLADLGAAAQLLPPERPSGNLNRPSRLAAYALFARIYLDMRKYDKAESYADSALAIYNVLIDYNTVSTTSTTPFSTKNDELIFNSRQVSAYSFSTSSSRAQGKIPEDLIALYNGNDLRLILYYDNGNKSFYTKKRGYGGTGLYPFTGLATDELYLIKAECLARHNKIENSLDYLNRLLITRYDNKIDYMPLKAMSSEEALGLVLLERRKELAWRGLRWHDLKRLNRDGANITLQRSLNGKIFSLIPNSPRYVFPIPDDEIILSGIQQNIR